MLLVADRNFVRVSQRYCRYVRVGHSGTMDNVYFYRFLARAVPLTLCFPRPTVGPFSLYARYHGSGRDMPRASALGVPASSGLEPEGAPPLGGTAPIGRAKRLYLSVFFFFFFSWVPCSSQRNR